MLPLCASGRLAWPRYAALWSFRLLNFWRRRHGRSFLSGAGRGSIRALRRPRRSLAEGVTMIAFLWGAGAVVVAVYMIAALVRPERF